MGSVTESVPLGPGILTAIFVGLGVIILVFVIKWIKQERSAKGNAKIEKSDKLKSSSDAPSKHGKKEQAGTLSKQSSKKKLTERENRRSARTGEKGFSHPWLLASLKGHSGRVLDMDFAANGKYLVSCGDDDPDPGGLSCTNTDSSSSSDSNKENSSPSSQSPSPILQKGLSRRQRKNRKRELVKSPLEEENGQRQKKNDADSTKLKATVGGSNETIRKRVHHQVDRVPRALKQHHHAYFEPLEEYRKLNLTEDRFASILASKYVLRPEVMAIMGYPTRPNKRAIISEDYTVYICEDAANYEIVGTKNFLLGGKKHHFDVYAKEFVPKSDSNDSGQGSGSSSEEESSCSSSEGSDDLAVPPPRYRTATINSRAIYGRVCVRCGLWFYTTANKYITMEPCSYHWGKLRTLAHGYGPLEFTCCGGNSDSIGCAMGKLHVWNGRNEATAISSYVETERPKKILPNGNYGVYSLDCEMSYTVTGLEVTKVTVVDIQGRPVYNEFVRPHNEVVDFNTRFSGVTPEDFANNNPKSLIQVQKDLKRLINSETVLIGHGLENDLKALKMIHKTVVDTTFTFPHYKGLPYRRSLRSLVKSCLRRDIQCAEKGHDSLEDARACMELMLYRLRRDSSTYS